MHCTLYPFQCIDLCCQQRQLPVSLLLLHSCITQANTYSQFTLLVFHLVYTRLGSLHSAAIQELLDPRVIGPNNYHVAFGCQQVKKKVLLLFFRYLQEVVQVLESDPEFRKKLETADVEKIRDGSIANELEMVNHQVKVTNLLTRNGQSSGKSYHSYELEMVNHQVKVTIVMN